MSIAYNKLSKLLIDKTKTDLATRALVESYKSSSVIATLLQCGVTNKEDS